MEAATEAAFSSNSLGSLFYAGRCNLKVVTWKMNCQFILHPFGIIHQHKKPFSDSLGGRLRDCCCCCNLVEEKIKKEIVFAKKCNKIVLKTRSILFHGCPIPSVRPNLHIGDSVKTETIPTNLAILTCSKV